LLEIGQASGELEELLERLGHRYTRRANRLIERLTDLLEPCVILVLAVLVGIVVMAAVLPLLRMQEIL
jgi:type IV pilus assembly protein PilC